jgi:uncharacterized paraquat-inducible protein A
MPELSHLKPDDRRRLLANVKAGRLMTGIIVRSLGMSLLAALIAGALISWPSRMVSILAACVVGTLVFSAIYHGHMLFIRAQIRFHMMKASRGERVPVCLKCGYDLIASQQDRCPECGAPVRVPDP